MFKPSLRGRHSTGASLILVACLIGCNPQDRSPSNRSADGNPAHITVDDLRKVSIIGQLGYPIGQPMRIEGIRIENPYPSHPRKQPPSWNSGVYLTVLRVSRKPLPNPVVVCIPSTGGPERSRPEIGERFEYQGFEQLHVFVDGEETGDQDISIFSGFSITFAITPGRVLKNLPTPPEVIDGYQIGKIKTETVMGSFGVPVGRTVTGQGRRVPDVRHAESFVPWEEFKVLFPWEEDDYVQFEVIEATVSTPSGVMKFTERYRVESFNGLPELGKPLKLTGKESLYLFIRTRDYTGGPQWITSYPEFHVTSFEKLDPK